MNWKNYCKDRCVEILLYLVMSFLVVVFLWLFHTPPVLWVVVSVLLFCFGLALLIYGYIRRYRFYQQLEKYLGELDEKYLVTETIGRPVFLEGCIFYDTLREIDKSMYDEVEKHEASLREFKEYVELWVHEVKLPIASSFLILHNNRNETTRKLREQMQRIESYVEQVLYYVRSENAEKDYLIKPCGLSEIIGRVIQRNRDALLCQKISVVFESVECEVYSDSKWLEFIINQIVSNSLKYAKKENARLEFLIEENGQAPVLEIRDNGIGIPKGELARVFDKSYTGSNGRKVASSTGMGLYLCRELCAKLGHEIEIDSQEGEFTCVRIKFHSEEYYQVLKE